MNKDKIVELPARAETEGKSYLEQWLRQGAQKLLQSAIENEVTEYLHGFQSQRDEAGHQRVVRNGHLPERELITGIGPLSLQQPRVRHRDQGRFSSALLPPYLRRLPSVDALIPALYLHGVSTGDFSEALETILGIAK